MQRERNQGRAPSPVFNLVSSLPERGRAAVSSSPSHRRLVHPSRSPRRSPQLRCPSLSPPRKAVTDLPSPQVIRPACLSGPVTAAKANDLVRFQPIQGDTIIPTKNTADITQEKIADNGSIQVKIPKPKRLKQKTAKTKSHTAARNRDTSTASSTRSSGSTTSNASKSTCKDSMAAVTRILVSLDGWKHEHDLDALRMQCSRLARILAREARVRDMLGRKKQYLSMIISSLKVFDDDVCLTNLTRVSSVLLTHSPRVCERFIAVGIADPILRLLTKGAMQNDSGLSLLMDCLNAIAPYDSRLPVLCRLTGSFRMILQYAKQKCKDSKALFPILKLLTNLSKNKATAGALHKHGATPLLLTVLKSNAFMKITGLLELACKVLANIVISSKPACIFFCKRKGVRLALDLLQEWNTFDKRNKLLALREAFISVLRATCSHRIGRKHVTESSALDILNNTMSRLDGAETETISSACCDVVTACLPILEVPSPENPIQFSPRPELLAELERLSVHDPPIHSRNINPSNAPYTGYPPNTVVIPCPVSWEENEQENIAMGCPTNLEFLVRGVSGRTSPNISSSSSSSRHERLSAQSKRQEVSKTYSNVFSASSLPTSRTSSPYTLLRGTATTEGKNMASVMSGTRSGLTSSSMDISTSESFLSWQGSKIENHKSILPSIAPSCRPSSSQDKFQQQNRDVDDYRAYSLASSPRMASTRNNIAKRVLDKSGIDFGTALRSYESHESMTSISSTGSQHLLIPTTYTRKHRPLSRTLSSPPTLQRTYTNNISSTRPCLLPSSATHSKPLKPNVGLVYPMESSTRDANIHQNRSPSPSPPSTRRHQSSVLAVHARARRFGAKLNQDHVCIHEQRSLQAHQQMNLMSFALNKETHDGNDNGSKICNDENDGATPNIPVDISEDVAYPFESDGQHPDDWDTGYTNAVGNTDNDCNIQTPVDANPEDVCSINQQQLRITYNEGQHGENQGSGYKDGCRITGGTHAISPGANEVATVFDAYSSECEINIHSNQAQDDSCAISISRNENNQMTALQKCDSSNTSTLLEGTLLCDMNENKTANEKIIDNFCDRYNWSSTYVESEKVASLQRACSQEHACDNFTCISSQASTGLIDNDIDEQEENDDSEYADSDNVNDDLSDYSDGYDETSSKNASGNDDNNSVNCNYDFDDSGGGDNHVEVKEYQSISEYETLLLEDGDDKDNDATTDENYDNDVRYEADDNYNNIDADTKLDGDEDDNGYNDDSDDIGDDDDDTDDDDPTMQGPWSAQIAKLTSNSTTFSSVNEHGTFFQKIDKVMTRESFPTKSHVQFTSAELEMLDEMNLEIVDPGFAYAWLKDAPKPLQPMKANLAITCIMQNVPGFAESTPQNEAEAVYDSPKHLRRLLLEQDMEKLQSAKGVIGKVVYDVDSPAAASIRGDALLFESRFECGNLRRAYQVFDDCYDLVLSSDINATGHHQWFFFAVSGMEVNKTYRFTIINHEKPGSQFNNGMQPVAYHSSWSSWRRVGFNICYYKNNHRRLVSGKRKNKTTSRYYSCTFSFTTPSGIDRESQVFIAYHYPYSYTALQTHLTSLEKMCWKKMFFRRQLLCRTLAENRCDLLTITSFHSRDLEIYPIDKRPYIVLSARVHPGETNSSYMMKGLLDFLCSDDLKAQYLRQQFVFKIIPMLNPDGVAHGSHRCSLAGCDLNRQWSEPKSAKHPTIYCTKRLIQYLIEKGRTVLLYCDFHGHSRRKNVFLYGCRVGGVIGKEQFLADLLDKAPLFSAKNSKFRVEKSKLSTSRVCVWQMGVPCSYTMESTYNTSDQGPYKGQQVQPKHLEEMGSLFVKSLLELHSQIASSQKS